MPLGSGTGQLHDIREMFLDVFARPGNRRPSAAEWLRAMAFLRNRYDPLTRTFASPQLLLTMMRTDRCAGHSCEHSTGHRNMAIAMGEGGSVPVTDGTAIYSCMLSSDDDTSSAAARISGSPESGFCLTNTRSAHSRLSLLTERGTPLSRGSPLSLCQEWRFPCQGE